MSNDYSERIERLLKAQQTAGQTPEFTEKQKRDIAALKPIYAFTLQMKASGIIKDVDDPGVFSGDLKGFDPALSIFLCDETRSVIIIHCNYGEFGIIGSYGRGLLMPTKKHFYPREYESTDALYDDVFQWIEDRIVEDIQLRPRS